jgi:hypothetical protein
MVLRHWRIFPFATGLTTLHKMLSERPNQEALVGKRQTVQKFGLESLKRGDRTKSLGADARIFN